MVGGNKNQKTFIFGIRLGHIEKASKGGGLGSLLYLLSSADKCYYTPLSFRSLCE